MRGKGPHVASLDEVRITRNGDAAVIGYAAPSVGATHFRLGPEVQNMSDQEILDQWNDCVRTREHAAAEYEHVAVEDPAGQSRRSSTSRRATSGRRAATCSAASSTT